jgi:HK97 family phage portal protein
VAWFRRSTDPTPEAPRARSLAALIATDRITSGRPESLPTAFACVSLIAHTAGQGRLAVSRGSVPTLTPEWLRRPDRLNGGIRGRALLLGAVTDLAVTGRAAYYATPVGSASWRIDPIHPSRIAATFDADHVRHWSLDGIPVPIADGPERRAGLVPLAYLYVPDVANPVGPIQAARYLLDGYLDTEAYARNVFRSGEVSGARLETDADIAEATAERWRDAWLEAHSDPTAPTIPVLGAGLRYVTDLIDPEAAAWVAARLHNATEVARLFRVPGRRVGLPSGDSVTYATARDDDAAFMRTTITAYTDPITEALSALLPSGRNATEDETVVIDWSALLAPTPSEHATYLLALLSAGVVTLAEVREALGYDADVIAEAEAITAAAAPTVTEGAAADV